MSDLACGYAAGVVSVIGMILVGALAAIARDLAAAWRLELARG